jgi:hypothetical protein
MGCETAAVRRGEGAGGEPMSREAEVFAMEVCAGEVSVWRAFATWAFAPWVVVGEFFAEVLFAEEELPGAERYAVKSAPDVVGDVPW